MFPFTMNILKVIHFQHLLAENAWILEVEGHILAEFVPLAQVNDRARFLAVIAVARGRWLRDRGLVEAMIAREVATACEVDISGREGGTVQGTMSTPYPPFHFDSSCMEEKLGREILVMGGGGSDNIQDRDNKNSEYSNFGIIFLLSLRNTNLIQL